MILKVLVPYDKKTALFHTPFVVRHIGEALREWEIITKDPQTRYGKNPEDFDLYQVGEFDDESGEVLAQKPMHLASGVSNHGHSLQN